MEIRTQLDISLNNVLALYHKYKNDLERVRNYQAALYKKQGSSLFRHILYSRRDSYKFEQIPGFGLFQKVLRKVVRPFYDYTKDDTMAPQLGDIEAEITYMLLREARPETVVEISPCKGWSTTWILHALRDNGHGAVHSFDLIDEATKYVPQELYMDGSKQRWVFVKGDAKETMKELPPKIDYLFLDSDHTAQFAEWYIKELFPKLRPGIPVSVHDVFVVGNDRTGRPITTKNGEAEAILHYLKENKIDFMSLPKNSIHHDVLMQKKRALGLGERIHHVPNNSMIYFTSR